MILPPGTVVFVALVSVLSVETPLFTEADDAAAAAGGAFACPDFGVFDLGGGVCDFGGGPLALAGAWGVFTSAPLVPASCDFVFGSITFFHSRFGLGESCLRYSLDFRASLAPFHVIFRVRHV